MDPNHCLVVLQSCNDLLWDSNTDDSHNFTRYFSYCKEIDFYNVKKTEILYTSPFGYTLIIDKLGQKLYLNIEVKTIDGINYFCK